MAAGEICMDEFKADPEHADKKILLLGVGNLLYADEGLGVHAANYLRDNYEFSSNLSLEEGGTQGFWLLPSLISHNWIIIIDAVLGGEAPGTIYRLEEGALRKSLAFNDSQHQVDLEDILIQCDLMGKKPEHIVIIGMEPEDMYTLQMEMTDTVKASFPKFIGHVLEELIKSGAKYRAKKSQSNK